ncbi:MAG: hypothetical protein COA96_12485 [SAR86 cluster bacterium]|uniref:Methylamine utilization protein n=1 Tax=SAR86 cluster bacterium TaxID=2030880 RepID=A0A2A5AV62_9GAMM|nr:MAG: hypothetical protein COA96_12485 [SAR86 cluster bacterium]
MAQSVQVRLIDANGEPIKDAVIELFSEDNAEVVSVKYHEAKIDQIDKEFVPGVTIIVAGGSVSFPNGDDILHHVYSFSTAKTFDTPLYGRDDNNQYRETFDKPGVVEIGCNIHDWMLAYIYVGESDKMAISNAQGIAAIAELPAGEYRLKIWHARLSDSEGYVQTITVGENSLTELTVELQLARDRRIRRAPSSNRRRYR